MEISKLLSHKQAASKISISNKKLDKDFSEEFESASKREKNKQLEKLFNDIKKKGRQIVQTKNIKTVQEYKNHIKEYLQIVLKDAYRVDRIHDMYGSPAALVDIINKELDNLANTILAEEKDTIVILSKIENIEGLLIDTYR